MAWTAPELEELPQQAVHGRGRRRPPIGALLAVIGLIVLLAGGSGLLGGHDAPGPSNATGFNGPTATARSDPGSTPLVTPTAPCGAADRDPVPRVILYVNAIQQPGIVDSIEWLDGRSGPTSVPQGGSGSVGRVEIRSDVVSIIYTGGDVCALEWHIELESPEESIVLGDVHNPSRDPAIAQQNTFELPLWEWRGQSYDLDVSLTFPEVQVRGRWPIRILPFELPVARLATNRRDIPLLDGCDLELHLANGGSDQPYPCAGDVTAPGDAITTVARDAQLHLAFTDGWTVANPFVGCGQLTGVAFFPAGPPGCGLDPRTVDGMARFAAPPLLGEITLAISACAEQALPDAYNELCGTWYATINIV